MSEEEAPTPPEEWKKQLKMGITALKDFKPDDRLDLVHGIAIAFFFLGKTSGGWMSWLGNASVMREFKEDTLKEYFEVCRKNVLELLELDLKATDAYQDAMKKAAKNGFSTRYS